jgi:hypothetical protein
MSNKSEVAPAEIPPDITPPDDTPPANETLKQKLERIQAANNTKALAALDAANNEAMPLGDLLDPTKSKHIAQVAAPPPTSARRQKYTAPPLPEALKASDYFGDTGNDDGAHYDHPGATTTAEQKAAGRKVTQEDLVATERMIQDARTGKGF